MPRANANRNDPRTPRARSLRRASTDAERKLWWHLRRLLSDTHFRRQATIGPYFADFACHSKKLVIEVEGGQHGEPKHLAADAKRTAYLVSQGYRVLRFGDRDVLMEINVVMATIYEALRDEQMWSPPTPSPSPPQAGGGEQSVRRRSAVFAPARTSVARRPSPSRGG